MLLIILLRVVLNLEASLSAYLVKMGAWSISFPNFCYVNTSQGGHHSHLKFNSAFFVLLYRILVDKFTLAVLKQTPCVFHCPVR